ncbi:hypothetical protein [Streptomyces morookaense]|nr:hypothetical protein [Streptomyces morookaense]
MQIVTPKRAPFSLNDVFRLAFEYIAVFARFGKAPTGQGAIKGA